MSFNNNNKKNQARNVLRVGLDKELNLLQMI